MSGRIRTIKPELLDDAVTAGISDMAFRLFMATIVLADDYGRLRAEPAWLMGQVYWNRSIQVETFQAALAELDPLVLFYEVNGQRYAEIRNWSKHQKVSHPGKPRIPPPPETLVKPSGESPETLVPDLRSPTKDLRPPTKEGPVTGPTPRVWGRGTTAEEALNVFADAITSVTGEPFVMGPAPFLRDDLCALLNRGAPKGETLAATLMWLGDTVQSWVKADPDCQDRKPSKLTDWLNAGKPDRRRRTRPQAIVQSGENRAWKIPEEMP
jgi:hypothetical protein